MYIYVPILCILRFLGFFFLQFCYATMWLGPLWSHVTAWLGPLWTHATVWLGPWSNATGEGSGVEPCYCVAESPVELCNCVARSP